MEISQETTDMCLKGAKAGHDTVYVLILDEPEGRGATLATGHTENMNWWKVIDQLKAERVDVVGVYRLDSLV
ncbi:MAG: hypothetical protein VW362_06155, partial [Candidatus Nanopelagicales bacterium]